MDINAVKDFQIEFVSEQDIGRWKSLFTNLETKFETHNVNDAHIQSTKFWSQKLYAAERHKAHRDEIDKLESERKELERKVLNVKIPVLKNLGFFGELLKEAVTLEEKILKHGDSCYAISNLRQAVRDIKVKIQALEEDNKMWIGWTSATGAVTGVSIGIAFIPIVGIFISGGIVAIPYLGKLAHRLAVSQKRRKRFLKKKR